MNILHIFCIKMKSMVIVNYFNHQLSKDKWLENVSTARTEYKT